MSSPSWVPQPPIPTPPSPTARPGEISRPETETWREKFLAALPLFLVGGICVGLAVYFYFLGANSHVGGSGTVSARPWILFVALGITGLAAGLVALLLEDAPEGEIEEAHVPVNRSTALPVKTMPPPIPGRPRESETGPSAKDRPRPSLPASRPAIASPGRSDSLTFSQPGRAAVKTRAWDESPLRGRGPTRNPKEDWDESSEEFAAAASKPAPPDFVLTQIDEIERSLRRKPAAPHTD